MWPSQCIQRTLLLLLFSHYTVSYSLQPHGLQPVRIPSPINFPGRNTGVVPTPPLQGIFPTHGSNLNFLLGNWIILFYFFSSTSLLLPAHLPPPLCTHAQSCNLMDCSQPGSSVHGLFQERILEWVAISFSQMDSLPLSHLGSPIQRTLVHNIYISMNENCVAVAASLWNWVPYSTSSVCLWTLK